jgi:hypothetical protein
LERLRRVEAALCGAAAKKARGEPARKASHLEGDADPWLVMAGTSPAMTDVG